MVHPGVPLVGGLEPSTGVAVAASDGVAGEMSAVEASVERTELASAAVGVGHSRCTKVVDGVVEVGRRCCTSLVADMPYLVEEARADS